MLKRGGQLNFAQALAAREGLCSDFPGLRREAQAVERAGKKNIALVTPKPYVFPEVKRRSGTMPVVVGMGPAGLLAALFLARAGQERPGPRLAQPQ